MSSSLSNTIRHASKMARLLSGNRPSSIFAGNGATSSAGSRSTSNILIESTTRRVSSTPSFFSSNSSSTSDSSSSTTHSADALLASEGGNRSTPRIEPRGSSKTGIASFAPDPENLTSWASTSPKALILPTNNRDSIKDDVTDDEGTGLTTSSIKQIGGNGNGKDNDRSNNENGKDNDSSNNGCNEETFMSAVSSETLQNLMKSLFYIPLTEGGCALGFFTRVCMRDLASQWTNELQEALTDIAGKETKDLDDTWACGFVTSCSVFRKAVNVTDQLPLVSALSGKTFLFDFDNVLNYNFSDPFTDVAFVQLTPQQIWKAQRYDFNFLPMNLSLYHDIYDKSVDSLINGKDVVIAKQLQGYLTQVMTENIGTDATVHEVMNKKREQERTGKTKDQMTTLLDDSVVSGAAPAVNRSGELVGISHRKLNGQDVLLPTRMLSSSIATDLNSQIGASDDPHGVSRPEWMDFQIRYTDLHDLGLLVHPLAHDNDEMVDFVDWPFYETWYQRTSPINQLTFVLTDKHLYLRPEEEYLGDEGKPAFGFENGTPKEL